MLELETVKTVISELSTGQWLFLDEILHRCGRGDAVRGAIELLVREDIVETEGQLSPRYRLLETYAAELARSNSDAKAEEEALSELSEDERRIRELVIGIYRKDPDAMLEIIDDARNGLRLRENMDADDQGNSEWSTLDKDSLRNALFEVL